MTDHTTSIARRIAGGLLAATTSLVPVALWASAAPAGAAPGDLTISGDGCTVSFAGEGFGFLSLSMTYNGRTGILTETVSSSGLAEYGSTWLLPLDATATFTIDGFVGNDVVASESIQLGTCTTPYDESITITVSEEGAPNPGSIYDIQLVDCGNAINFDPVVSLTAGQSAEIPVFPLRTYCPTPVAYPSSVVSIEPSAASLSTGYGGHPTVVVHAVHEVADPPPPADPPVDPEPEVEPESIPSTPVEPTAPAAPAPAAPEAPASPAASAPAATQVEAATDVRAALPRTGVEGGLAPVGAALAAAGAGLLRARRRFATGS